MQLSIERRITFGLAIALAILIINALVSYRAARRLIDNDRLVSHTHEVIAQLETTLSTITDAETGERGYLLTGDDSYLAPYNAALSQIDADLNRLTELTADNLDQQTLVASLQEQIANKIDELRQSIESRKTRGFQAALRLVSTGRGSAAMNAIRATIDTMESQEADLLIERRLEAAVARRDATLTFSIATLVAGGLLVILYLVIMHDLTERKKAEALQVEQSRLLDLAHDAIMVRSANGAISFWNRRAEEMYGWRADEAIGQVSHTLLHTMFPSPLAEIKAELTRQGWWEGTLIHTRKDGTPVVVASRWALRREQRGEDGVILEVNSDITAQRRVEEERTRLLASERAARERAESASRAKDEFVAMISHELRAPLNSILGWTQLLGTGKLDHPETARAVDAIERGAKAQVQLIGDLLDVSRAITGKLVLSPRIVELKEVVESAVDSVSPAADAKSIRLNVHFDPRGGCVFGDPGRLHQIAWNLLSNAVKFTPRSGSIDVRIERREQDLQVSVSDSGAGINPEFLPYVFDRFSQAKTSSDRKYGGLGLGLAIVKHLVELHGGTVEARSAGDGKGSTFTVTLPIYAVHEHAMESQHPERDAEDGTSSIRLDGLRIVIVDDDADAREMLMSMLVRAGAEVKACEAARDALETIEQWRPFALVSDIGMPDEDGYFLIRELRARQPERGGDIPAIALTGYARSEDRTRALAAGFQTHVAKPVESAELIMVIASLAGRTGKARSGIPG
jgi:PAS domain S-box-containing protein